MKYALKLMMWRFLKTFYLYKTAYKQLEKRLDSSLIAFSHEENFQVVEQ